jgi:hypothetical protein
MIEDAARCNTATHVCTQNGYSSFPSTTVQLSIKHWFCQQEGETIVDVNIQTTSGKFATSRPEGQKAGAVTMRDNA